MKKGRKRGVVWEGWLCGEGVMWGGVTCEAVLADFFIAVSRSFIAVSRAFFTFFSASFSFFNSSLAC